MRTAVYSGTFDPLHIGHLAILRYLSGREDISHTLLVVSPQNPFKDASRLVNATMRLGAAAEALRRHPELKASVEDIEFSMEAPHYTYRTLCALRERQRGEHLVLVIGGDNLAAFRKWKDYSLILKEFGVIVYPREGVDSEKEKSDLLSEDPAFRIELADIPLVNISSTQIREILAHGGDATELLM